MVTVGEIRRAIDILDDDAIVLVDHNIEGGPLEITRVEAFLGSQQRLVFSIEHD